MIDVIARNIIETETWGSTTTAAAGQTELHFGPNQVSCADLGLDDDDGTDERAAIASTAPEALRLLLELEWTRTEAIGVNVRHGLCVECFAAQKDGHLKSCALDALLRKAGAR